MDNIWLIGIIVWVISALICMALSQKKGYGAPLGLLTGAVLSLVGVIVLGFMPYKEGHSSGAVARGETALSGSEIAVVVFKGLAVVAVIVAILLIALVLIAD